MKGFYTCICYPDDLKKHNLQISDLVDSIQTNGGEVAYIIHNRDPCNVHMHFLCAWSKGFPDWAWFKDWMSRYYCSSPYTDQYGHKFKYHKITATGRDIDGMLHYLTHEHENDDET